MSYKQIKWLILIIPTLTIGVFEYVRHTFFLPYISMELGNWLAPLIVFAVTITFLRKLFSILEGMQEELNRERAVKATLEERERIARELHDGIAQSLFLLSVKVDQLEKGQANNHFIETEPYQGLRKTVHQVHEYVRQAIANLRYAPQPNSMPWMESVKMLVHDFAQVTGLDVSIQWSLNEETLSPKEKVELYASIREALLNVRKHAKANQVRIVAREERAGWVCSVEDDGQGYKGDPFLHQDRFGLRIMRNRADEMGWIVQMMREMGKTRIEIRKKG